VPDLVQTEGDPVQIKKKRRALPGVSVPAKNKQIVSETKNRRLTTDNTC